jgi:hypothetical protein
VLEEILIILTEQLKSQYIENKPEEIKNLKEKIETILKQSTTS